MTGSTAMPTLLGGTGSLVTTREHQTLVDLAMGFGSVFLGHAYPHVVERLREQAGGLWNASRLTVPAQARVEALLARLLPSGLRFAGLYSTGMEAAEFAMRLAATHTGRREFAGFACGMHGKSAMTASLCWANAPLRPVTQHILPFVDRTGEDRTLESLERLLRTESIAALFIEPIQGSNAGHRASDAFYRRAAALCRAHGTLCVFDEILTGLYRTGTAFIAERLGVLPDILLFAKCMGNGFPVSSIAIGESLHVVAAMQPGSTFSGNPLALAAVEGTLEAMAEIDMPARVKAIEETVRATLEPGLGPGAMLRGSGAMWFLELGPDAPVAAMQAAIARAGILVTASASSIRLLPAATIAPGVLRSACEKVAAVCLETA